MTYSIVKERRRVSFHIVVRIRRKHKYRKHKYLNYIYNQLSDFWSQKKSFIFFSNMNPTQETLTKRKDCRQRSPQMWKKKRKPSLRKECFEFNLKIIAKFETLFTCEIFLCDDNCRSFSMEMNEFFESKIDVIVVLFKDKWSKTLNEVYFFFLFIYFFLSLTSSFSFIRFWYEKAFSIRLVSIIRRPRPRHSFGKRDS